MKLGALERALPRAVPGHFALVMATGIVSIASDQVGPSWPAIPLLAINIAAYVALSLLLIARAIRHPRKLAEGLGDHTGGPGFFTVVAGTCVLGSQILSLTGSTEAAWGLWLCGLALWLFIIYGFFTAVTVRHDKPSIAEGISGSWLLITVSTQSIAILGTLLSAELPEGEPARDVLLFFCLAMYLVGCLLYLPVITLIIYRFTFMPFEVRSLTPPYWINMGALAITTLAGSLLLQAPGALVLESFAPFLRGFTFFFWAGGTWWIPLLVALGVWRHAVRRHPITYDVQYWALVFPLGMYTASTWQLSQALEAPFLQVIPRVTVFVALAAWTLTAAGLVRALIRSFRHA